MNQSIAVPRSNAYRITTNRELNRDPSLPKQMINHLRTECSATVPNSMFDILVSLPKSPQKSQADCVEIPKNIFLLCPWHQWLRYLTTAIQQGQAPSRTHRTVYFDGCRNVSVAVFVDENTILCNLPSIIFVGTTHTLCQRPPNLLYHVCASQSG